ncbi:MAG: hypothetical protein DI630_37150, partial [Gordonia sp. (in: high G+C Gram-positive bacteria)]
ERDPRVPAHRRIDEHGRPSEADLLRGLRGQTSDRLGVLTVVLRRTGEAIGYVGLVSGDQGPELAFELLSAHHGQGLATEAATAMIDATNSMTWRRLGANDTALVSLTHGDDIAFDRGRRASAGGTGRGGRHQQAGSHDPSDP